jgi:uncharacterized protein YkwD
MIEQTLKMNPSLSIISKAPLILICLLISATAAYADDMWEEEWVEEETYVAPLIDSYSGFEERAQDAFRELDQMFNDDEEVAHRQVQRAHAYTQELERRAHKNNEAQPRRPEREPATSSSSDFEAQVLRLVNQERARGGVCGGRSFPPSHPLRARRELALAAMHHGKAMAQRGFFDHRGPDGDTPQSRIQATGYQGRAWGENIAAGQRSPQSVMRAWMESPGHCSNILNPMFTELGVSFRSASRGKYRTYWVQAFGTPKN